MRRPPGAADRARGRWPTCGAVLNCAGRRVEVHEKTSRPTAATIRTVDAHLVHGDRRPSPRGLDTRWMRQRAATWRTSGARLPPRALTRAASWRIIRCWSQSGQASGDDRHPVHKVSVDVRMVRPSGDWFSQCTSTRRPRTVQARRARWPTPRARSAAPGGRRIATGITVIMLLSPTGDRRRSTPRPLVAAWATAGQDGDALRRRPRVQMAVTCPSSVRSTSVTVTSTSSTTVGMAR